MSSVQSHTASNANSIAQKASIAALLGSQDCLEKMRAAFAQRRNYMVEKIASIDGLSCIEPKGAFYIFVDVSKTFGRKFGGHTINTSEEFATLLQEHAKVAVVPGTVLVPPTTFASLMPWPWNKPKKAWSALRSLSVSWNNVKSLSRQQTAGQMAGSFF